MGVAAGAPGRLTRTVILLALGAAGCALPGQSLPPLPSPATVPEAPTPAELIPLRPVDLGQDPEGTRTLRFRGERVTEGPDAWVIEQGAAQSDEILLLADLIRYEPTTGMLTAEGRIRLEGPGLRLRCERLRMDWKARTGEAWALDLELPPNWSLKSSHVAFTSLKLWDFQAVEVSSCPEENPGWKAQISSLKVDLEGFATVRNGLLWVGPVPTYYYLPWAIYPVKPERSSGLLPISFSPNGPMGWNLTLPYYQTLGDRADLTFSPSYYSDQGTLWGGEVRWKPEVTHLGSFSGQYIRQQSNEEIRYRYAMKELWQREDGWQVAADLNSASDALIEADYGRGVGGLGAPTYDSNVFIGRNFRRFSLSLSASEQRSFYLPEDPFYDPEFPSSLQRRALPEFKARMYPIEVPLLFGLYLDAGIRTSRFSYNLDLGEGVPEPSYPWTRFDGYARLGGKLAQLGPLRLDLQLGGRYTHYSASLREPVFIPNTDRVDPIQDALSPFLVDGPALERRLGSGRLQVSGPQVGRVFEGFKLAGYEGELKHIVEPFVALTVNSKTASAGMIPRFDEVDSRPGVEGTADGEQSIEVGLKQHIFGRPGKGSLFADLVRWRISSRYHMEPILLSDGRTKSGWASLDNQIDVEPNRRLRVSFRRSADIATNDADTSLSADLFGKDGSRFSLALFSTGINTFLVRQRGIQMGGLRRFLDDQYRLEFQVNYDVQRDVFSSAQVAVARTWACLAVSARYSHVEIQTPGSLGGEDRLDLTLTLRSLGDLFSLGW